MTETQGNIRNHSGRSIFNRFWIWISDPHPDIKEIGNRRRAQLLAGCSLILIVPLLVGLLSRFPANNESEWFTVETFEFVGLVLFSLLAYIFSRTRYFQLGSVSLVTAFSLAAITNSISNNSVQGAFFFLLPAFVIGSALFRLIGITALVITNILILFLVPMLAPAIEQSFPETGIVLSSGILLILVVAFRNLIERERVTELREVNQEMRMLQSSLEQRVSDATRNLELAAEVSKSISMLRDIDTMLARAVNLIRERFDLYYTQIYLTDPTGRTLILRAGTGETGQLLLKRGHRLPVNMNSLNGIAASERRTVIVEDTTTKALHRANPLLPDTRSEMVVPLLVSERVVGVLDMQSNHPGIFGKENLTAFEALAGQLAVSITNAELFAEAEHAQAALETQTRRLTREGWRDFMDAIERKECIAFSYDLENITPLQTPIPDNQTDDHLTTPIQIADVQIGKLQFQREEAWTEEDFATTSTIARQVAQQIDNLRLLSQSEQYQAEARKALQRMTREGWNVFQDQFDLQEGFIYQDNEVKPINGNRFKEGLKYVIKVREEPIGELAVAGIRSLTEDDETLVTYVNEQLSEHIENIRLNTQTQKALSDTETLLNITSVASQSLDLDVTLKEVLSRVLKHTSAAAGLISIFNPARQKLEIVSHDLPEPFLQKLLADGLEGTLCDMVYQNQQTLLLENIQQESPIDVTGLLNLGFQAYQGVPLVSKGNTLGTLCVFYNRVLNKRQAETGLMEVVGQQIGVAIENSNLFEQSQKRAEELDILNEMGRTLTSLQDEQAIYETIFKYTGKLMNVNSFFVAIYDKERHEIALPVFFEMGKRIVSPNQPAGNGLTNYIINSRQPLLISTDFNTQVRELGIDIITVGDDSPTLSWLGVPLVFRDRVIGIVTVQSITTPGLYTERERDLLIAIASQASVALENAHVFRQTQQQAEQEATINQISQRIQSTTSVENALQVAIRELGRALGAKRTNVQLGLTSQPEINDRLIELPRR